MRRWVFFVIEDLTIIVIKHEKFCWKDFGHPWLNLKIDHRRSRGEQIRNSLLVEILSSNKVVILIHSCFFVVLFWQEQCPSWHCYQCHSGLRILFVQEYSLLSYESEIIYMNATNQRSFSIILVNVWVWELFHVQLTTLFNF